MPCNSDYLEPTKREQELKHAANLLVYVARKLGAVVEPWMTEQAQALYANDERCVTVLCDVLTQLSNDSRDRLLYSDARDKTARDLADWWEEHQRADARRRQDEEAEKRRKELRASGAAKLTREEKKALGVYDE
jgi:hypothetical protein